MNPHSRSAHGMTAAKAQRTRYSAMAPLKGSRLRVQARSSLKVALWGCIRCLPPLRDPRHSALARNGAFCDRYADACEAQP